MILRAGLMLVLGAGFVQAQDATKQTAPAIAGLMQSLPEKTLKRLRGAPDAFLQDAAGLIYGFGVDGGIDLAGVDAFVAAERARVRAATIERYLAADLNNDGDVSSDEVAVLAHAAAAGKRGVLLLGHDLSDANKDGVMAAAELRSFAQAAALKAMSDAEVDALRGFLVFDLNADGIVAMQEVAAGVTAMLDGA